MFSKLAVRVAAFVIWYWVLKYSGSEQIELGNAFAVRRRINFRRSSGKYRSQWVYCIRDRWFSLAISGTSILYTALAYWDRIYSRSIQYRSCSRYDPCGHSTSNSFRFRPNCVSTFDHNRCFIGFYTTCRDTAFSYCIFIGIYSNIRYGENWIDPDNICDHYPCTDRLALVIILDPLDKFPL